nr:hypothetical protein [Secundilactobacillus kimchicus]
MMTVEKTLLIDENMNVVFDWSKDEMPIRDAVWDYLMAHNGHDTLKTEEQMKPFMTIADSDVKKFVTAHLKTVHS